MASYKADMTYTVMAVVHGSVVTDYPNDCLTTLNQTCAEFEAAQKQAIAQAPNAPFLSVSCLEKTTSCTCTTVSKEDITTETGTYTTVGTTLTETAAGETPHESNYCVQERTLHITELDMTMTMGTMGQFKIVCDLVLEKQ